MEGDGDSSPSSPLFWSESQKAPSFSSCQPSSSSSSSASASGIRTWVLVLLVSVFVILFIPSFLSSNFRGFRPSLVKNGWDKLNLALVVFAILCGLLGRDVASGGGGGEYRDEGDKMSVTSPPPPTQSQEWAAIGYAPFREHSIYEANQTVGIRRMRGSSSYPNLRQELDAGDNWGVTTSWRFADDIQLYGRRRFEIPEWEISSDLGVKTIQVDTFELTKSPSKSEQPHPPPPPQTLSPPPPPIPPPPPTQMNRKTLKKLPHTSPKVTLAPQPAIPPPPPPPPPPPVFPEPKKKSHKKLSGTAAKDIATAIALFYKRKRRSKAKKIHDNDSLASVSPSAHPPPPPPPPPPPLPSSVFSHLFSTKKAVSKSKRNNSIFDHRSSPQPPPPPPPPPPKKESSLFSDHRLRPRNKREKLPTFMNAYPIAPPSPLPPPPPPPPPPPTYDEDGGDAKSPDGAKASPFCPSPDVNSKADVFIKRFRDGLKLEKLNSIREKQRRQQDPPQERQQEDGMEMENFFGENRDEDGTEDLDDDDVGNGRRQELI